MSKNFGRKQIPVFAMASFLAIGLPNYSDAANVYIPLGKANGIAVVDVDSNRVIKEIGGVVNSHGLAATPDGRFLVASSMTDFEKGQHLPTKPTAMSEADHQSHHGAATGHATPMKGKRISYITLIHTRSGEVKRQIEVPGAVHHNAITPSGRFGLFTHPSNAGISVVDLQHEKTHTFIPTGPVPNYVIITKNSRLAYVSNSGSNNVSEIDLESWKVRRTFWVGSRPEHMVLSPDEKRLYVNNVNNGAVAEVDLTKGKVSRTFEVGRSPHGIDLSDDGAFLFVSSKKEDKAVSIRLSDGQIRTLSLKPAPYHVTAIKGFGKLYISSRKKPLVWVIDQRTFKVLDEIAIRGEGHEMAMVN